MPTKQYFTIFDFDFNYNPLKSMIIKKKSINLTPPSSVTSQT